MAYITNPVLDERFFVGPFKDAISAGANLRDIDPPLDRLGWDGLIIEVKSKSEIRKLLKRRIAEMGEG